MLNVLTMNNHHHNHHKNRSWKNLWEVMVMVYGFGGDGFLDEYLIPKFTELHMLNMSNFYIPIIPQ